MPKKIVLQSNTTTIKAIETMSKRERVDAMMFAKLIETCEYLNIPSSITAEDWNDLPFQVKYFLMDVLDRGQTASRAYSSLLMNYQPKVAGITQKQPVSSAAH
jgi:hypothetical protein